MNKLLYWQEKHREYSNKSWIEKPSLFSQFAVHHFPTNGYLLDLGAGQGQDSRFFAQRNYQVVSTDFCCYALSLSKSKAKESKFHMEFIELDLAKNLPFANDSFEIVYSHLALHYFDDTTTKKLFSEIHRILKVEGVLAALVNSIDDEEIQDKKCKKIAREFYLNPSGETKRFFSLDYLMQITKNFTYIVFDNEGETYKDQLKNLVRFVGTKTA